MTAHPEGDVSGHPEGDVSGHPEGDMTEPMLRVTDLTVRHGGLVALDHVSMDVDEGSIVGLIGPNGAGKTTFIDALSGFVATSDGRVVLDGRRIDDLAPHLRARRGLVRTFQSLELFEDLTVTENLFTALDRPGAWSLLVDAVRPKRRDDRGVAEVLELLGLADAAARRPSELSNGQRHLVALGRALVAHPRLLLLDEPAAGLDPGETAALNEVLRALPERGTTVLLVEHDMSVVLEVCDRVDVIDFGGLIASGTPAEVRADERVIAAYLGDGIER